MKTYRPQRTVQSVTLDWYQADLFGEEVCYLHVTENHNLVLRDGPYPNMDTAMKAYKVWLKLNQRQ